MPTLTATGFRLQRHYLAARAGTGELAAVARRLCGLHAQVLSSADLILWARVRGHRSDALESALWEERSLVKTWLMRGTLHLVTADDLPLYVGAVDTRGEYQPAWLRAFEVEAVEMERLIEAIADALDGRALTREQLAAQVRPRIGAGLAKRLSSGWGEFLKPAARRGVLCFGPSRGQNVTFVRPDQWLAGWRAAPSRPEARTELLRRFLAAYGPASAADFEHWLGVNRRVKEPWEAMRGELEEVAPKSCLLARDRQSLERARARGVRLLPAFDPFVLFPRSARPVANEWTTRVYRTAGWISATVVDRGRVVGVWEHRVRGRRLALRVEAFGELGEAARLGAAREARRLARYVEAQLDLSTA